MFSIIGGTYTEQCDHPRWAQVAGSGARAAVAVSDIARSVRPDDEGRVRLWTWYSNKEQQRLKKRMDACGALVHGRIRKEPIEFIYSHALRRPELYPSMHLISKPVDEEINAGDAALVFGVVECHPRVTADRLVYDPQSGSPVTPFNRAGHSAKHAALVANMREAVDMAVQLGWKQKSAPTALSIGRYLLRESSVEVVVIKEGAKGASVITPRSQENIPPHLTKTVFKIGSGDIFSAIFAIHWAGMGVSPGDSAKWASIATAYYCSQRGSWVIPATLQEVEAQVDEEARKVVAGLGKRTGSRRVYLAGPLFTIGQRHFLDEVRQCLEDQGMEVFSPKDEVGLVRGPSDVKRVAEADLKALDKCGLVFALLDGLDPGTLFEIGYAARRGKSVLAFGEGMLDSDMTMLRGTGCSIYSDLTTAIYHMGWLARQS